MWSKIRHVIWDWNGTILDDAQICADVLNEILELHSFEKVSVAQFKELVEFPVRNLYLKLGFDLDKISFAELSDHFHTSYLRRRSEAKLHPQVVPLLEQLHSKSFSQSVLSAHPKEILDSSVRMFGVERFFSLVSGPEDNTARGKKELGETHIESLGVPSEQLLLIGDTDHDVEVANHLGIPCLLVASGHQSRRKLEMLGVPVYEHLGEVLKSLNS